MAQFLLYMLYTSRRTESTLPTLFQSQALDPGPKPRSELLLSRVPGLELVSCKLLLPGKILILILIIWFDPCALHVAGSIWSCYNIVVIHKLSVWLHKPQQFLIQPWCCWSSWWCLLIVSLFIYFRFIYIIGKEPCFLCKKKIANARTREVIIQSQIQSQPRPEQAETRPRAVPRRDSPSTTPRQKAKLLAKTHEKGAPWGKIKAFL